MNSTDRVHISKERCHPEDWAWLCEKLHLDTKDRLCVDLLDPSATLNEFRARVGLRKIGKLPATNENQTDKRPD